MTPSKLAGALLAVCVLSSSPVARAQLTESAPVIRVEMSAGYAKVIVRRSWKNATIYEDVLDTDFTLPSDAVLQGFSATSVRGGWLPMRLLPAREAAKAFHGSGEPGGEAVWLRTHNRANFDLTITPIPAGSTRMVSYTLLVPTSYAEGSHRFFNPWFDSDETQTVPVRVVATAPGQLRVDDEPWVDVRGPRGGAMGEMIQLVPKSTKPIAGGLAFVALENERRALRYHMELAPRLSRVPRAMHVVVVLDSSRSLSEAQAAGSVAAARAYLAHVPDAHVDLVTFDRTAHSLLGKLTTVAKADAVLSALTLQRRNGSEVATALALAKGRLEGVPARATKRVVLFTDALTRASLDVSQLGLEDVGALLHVAVMKEPLTELARRDEHPWATRVATTGGVVWDAPARANASREDLERTFEELVRPMRLHHTVLSAPAAPELAVQVAGELSEGSGVEGIAITEHGDPRVSLRGSLWTKPVTFTLQPSLRETRLWQGLLLRSPLATELTDAETKALALASNVATEHTSFIAATPGSRELAQTIRLGSVGTSSRCGGVGWGSRAALAPPQAWLKAHVQAAYRRCQGGSDPAHVTLELSREEIVDVQVQAASGLSACLAQEVWDLLLPAGTGSAKVGFQLELDLPISEETPSL